jgi:hypothetical protein
MRGTGAHKLAWPVLRRTGQFLAYLKFDLSTLATLEF